MSSGARDGAPGHLAAPPSSSAAATTAAATAAAATAAQGGGGRNGPPNYHRLEKLGKGSFATVYRAVHVQTNQEAAIKHISQERLTVKLQENLESEISILKNHAHRNIVRLYDIERNDRHIYIVLEYCRGGDLQKFIKTQPRGRLSEGTARHFMRHLAAGLKFLYDRNLVHRDIKPQNLLLTEPSPTAVLKIADFGFARHLEGTSMAETLCGSPLYMAPEILGQNQYNAKADLWSTGAVLFEMVAGRPPFAAQSQVELLKVIRRPLQIPSDVELSRACLALLQGLLKREPLERISFEGFFQDPFLDMKGSGFLERAAAEEGGVCGGEQQAAAVGKASTPREPEMPLANRRLTSIQEAPEAVAAAAAVAAASPQQQHPQGPRLHRADSGSRRSSSEGSAAPPPPPFGLGDDDGHDSGIGGGGGGQGRHSACSSSSSSLPFHAPPPSSSSSRATTATATTLPSPRVNPFKPLAASPPGAVAVSAQQQQGRGSGAGQSGSGSSSSSSSSGGRRGAPGMGEGSSESLESDGFVIVNAGGHSISPRNLASAAAAPATPSRSASSSISMGTQTGPGPLLPTPSRSGAGSGWGGGGGGGMGRTPTHAAGKSSSSSSSCTSSSSSSSGGGGGGCSARDSVDGALRALSYLEASTRRAILIASLGDAKAMAGLNHRQRAREEAAERRLQQQQQQQQQDGEEKGEGGEGGGFGDDDAGVGGLMQGLGLGGLGLGLRKPPEWAGADRSPPARQQQQQQHPKQQLKALEAEEAKAAALLVEALVLYLKALSVVGTGIKALRQVADVIHTHLGGGGGGSGSGQGHWRAASSGSLEGGGAVHERIAALREWLELHLSIVLDRAQECRMQIGQGSEPPGEDSSSSSSSSSSHNTSSASALLASAGAAAGNATRSAEELLYKHALSLAREGAVKELVGQTQGALEYYAQARLTMEALLAEPLLPPADQQLLERYVEELAASCARLAGVGAASAAAAAAGVTAAAVTFGTRGKGAAAAPGGST